MATTNYIISLSKNRHRIVRTNDARNQTTVSLSKGMGAAHTAFAGGTGDEVVRRMSRHPAARTWRSLEALADDCCLSPDEVSEARRNGASI